jgi:hypothetical protein
MGYALDIALSVPLGILIYILTEKLIAGSTSDNEFNVRVQKSFVVGFIVGMGLIGLGMSVFGKTCKLNNTTIQMGLYGAGFFLVLNSTLINWELLDEGTKILMITIAISGIIVYSYQNNRSSKLSNKTESDEMNLS